jgi:predicted  nucleic acid-binding Zn-ribbon protein
MIKQEFLTRAYQKHGNKYDYVLVPDTFMVDDRISIICPKHGRFKQTGTGHMVGQGCSDCGRDRTNAAVEKKRQLAALEYDQKLAVASKGKIRRIEEYQGNKIKIDHECQVCFTVWLVRPNNTLRINPAPSGCPECWRKINIGIMEAANEKLRLSVAAGYEQKVYEVHGGKIQVLDPYVTAHAPIRHKCTSCCHVWPASPSNIVNGKPPSGCTRCSSSKMEEALIRYCEAKNIRFVPQKTFEGCKNINLLRFDGWLPDFNLCIETDGIQHFETNGWQTEEAFAKTQCRDSIKDRFCADNKIHFMRIPYWMADQMEEMLDQVLFSGMLESKTDFEIII